MASTPPTTPRAHRSQRASLRPERDLRVGSALVGDRRYDRLLGWEGEYVRIPGVAGTDELPAIPERLVRFIGAPVCVEISVKQINRFVGMPGPDGPDGAGAIVGALTGWSVAFNGCVVYGGMAPTIDPLPSLLAAAAAVGRLHRIPCDIWDEAALADRPVYLDGGPATVRELRGATGEVVLATGPGEMTVDLLSDRIWWHRDPTDEETSPHD